MTPTTQAVKQPPNHVLRVQRGALLSSRGTFARGNTSLVRPAAPLVHPAPPVLPAVLKGRSDLTVLVGNALAGKGKFKVETPAWTNEEYHAYRDAVSTSTLKQLLRSAAHLKAYWEAPSKPTNARLIGNAVHAAVLEPNSFVSQYVVWDGDRRGKKYEEFEKANVGKSILKVSEKQDVVGMRDSVMAYEEYPIGELIRTGINETSIVWVDEETGVRCKVRPDNRNDYGIFDLKSTDDARPRAFIRLQCVPLDYDLQAYMYTEGVYQLTGKRLDFYFIAVEASAPYATWVHQASEAMLASGERKFRLALRKYVETVKVGKFPAYDHPCSVIEWPHYA